MNRLIKVFFIQGNYYWMIAGLIFCGSFFISCEEKKTPEEKVIVEVPEKMDDKVKGLIGNFLDYSLAKKGKLDDSTILYQLPLLVNLYKQRSFSPQWSSSQKWLAQGDSLLLFIENARLYGLFPADYHAHQLMALKKAFAEDAFKDKETKDAAYWARRSEERRVGKECRSRWSTYH